MSRHRVFRRCGQAGLLALLLALAPAAARADIQFLLLTPSGPDLFVLDERMETQMHWYYPNGLGMPGVQAPARFIQAIPGVTWESLDPRPGGTWVKFQAENTGWKFWVTSTGKMCPGANSGQWMVQYGRYPQVPDPAKSYIDNFIVDGITCVEIPWGTVGCVVIIPDGDGLSIHVSGVRWNVCSDFGATLFASIIGKFVGAVAQGLGAFELPPGSLVTLELGDAVLNAARNEVITLMKPLAVKELSAHGAALLEAGKAALCARGDLPAAICNIGVG